MFSNKAIALAAVLGASGVWSGAALADQPPPPPTGVISADQPGQASFLDTLSQQERARELDKQQKTFELQIDAAYAKALKAYCDTGYGDDRCVKAEAVKPPPAFAPTPGQLPSPVKSDVPPPPNFNPAPAIHELPRVLQIAGLGDDLVAVLEIPNGGKMRVLGPDKAGHARSLLPGGERVVLVAPGEVLVQGPADAQPRMLLFSNGPAPASVSLPSPEHPANQ